MNTWLPSVISAISALVVVAMATRGNRQIEQYKEFQARARLTYDKRWEAREELLRINYRSPLQAKRRFGAAPTAADMITAGSAALETIETLQNWWHRYSLFFPPSAVEHIEPMMNDIASAAQALTEEKVSHGQPIEATLDLASEGIKRIWVTGMATLEDLMRPRMEIATR